MFTKKNIKLSISKKMTLSVFCIIVVLIIGVVAMRKGGTERIAPDTRLKVAATIFPIYDIVQNIGGDAVAVKLLLPQGESLDNVDAVFKNADVSSEKAVFMIGHGLDDTNVPSNLSAKQIVVDKDIDILLEQGSTGSPYYWLSVRNAEKIAATVASTLTELDPANAATYAQNLDQYTLQLKNLDATIAAMFKEVVLKKMVVYGYDWGYFAQDYGFSIASYVPEVKGAPISQGKLDEMRDSLKTLGLKTIFTDIHLNPVTLAPLLGDGNPMISSLDVLGGVEGQTTYYALMAYNARTIFEGTYVPLPPLPAVGEQ